MAACNLGLDRFIVSRQLSLKGSGERWRPPYISDMLELTDQGAQKRVMATKTLADVLEAIIGVSYLDGGLEKALQCISLFLGEGQFQDFQTTRDVLFEAVEPRNMVLPAIYEPLEATIGYEFRNKALLVEAITHPSYITALYSFERLEFLGDAVLDHVIVQGAYTKLHFESRRSLYRRACRSRTLVIKQLTCRRTLRRKARSTGELANAPPPDRAR